MRQFLTTILPVTAIAVLAYIANFLVEYPEYAASPLHRILVFLLAVICWFCLTIGFVRKAYGFMALGTGLLFLALATVLYPDLWLRWPEATLAGLAISQLGAMSAYRFARKSGIKFSIAVLFVDTLALVPILLVIYLPWSQTVGPYIGAVSFIILAGGLYAAWLGKQRKIGAVSFIGFLSSIAVIGILLVINLRLLQPDLNARQEMEESLVFLLLLIAAVYISDQLYGDRSLRSAPHMSLDPSMRDGLTNLANRRTLETFGPQLVSQSKEAGRAISVILCDIDHFKLINDTHGHQAGDAVLKKTAAQLLSKVRKSDLVARYGGEEFAIILPGSPLAPSLRLAESMRAAIQAESVSHGENSLRCTLSFGVATAFPEEASSLSDLIAKADANLYRAKREGRNRVKSDDFLPKDF